MGKNKIEYIKNTFSKKNKVELYIPLLENKEIYEEYIVELFDLLDVYMCPVQNNIHKNDILEYFICPSYLKMGLFNFLRFKRYIATEEDFKNLFIKYSTKEKIDKNIIEGYKIFINESPLKTPSSKLPTFYFKIGQLVEFDHKKDETKNIAQFLTNF